MTTALHAHSRLGRHEVLSLLGEGGMGTVYLAEDTQIGRKVAVKILPIGSGEDAKRRFIREARAVGALDHPNICTVHEVGEHDGQSYIVMQYVEGRTLASWVDAGELRLEQALDYAIQVCEALQAAHDRGIVHRDIKPSNVMVTGSGQVKVLDFGLAKMIDQKTSQSDLLTRPGVVAGTRPYMSPEQLRGEKLDARSDIFSFGVMLYEMVTGRRPFDGESTEATITAILFFDPPKIETTSPLLQKIEPIIRKALQKDRDRRHHTIRDLGHDLIRTRSTLSIAETVERLPIASKFAPTDTLAKVSRGRKRSIDSIAVIPRRTPTADPDHVYLLEGIAEGIIDQLTRTPRLRVLARSTAFRFGEGELDVQALRRNLGVSSVAAVSVTVEARRLELSVQLLRTENSEALLNRRYSGSIDTAYMIADEATRDLLAVARPASTRKRRASAGRALDPQVYHLFLKARYQWNKRSPEGLKEAMDLFQQAIEIDPMFARAYVGLADAYNLLGFLEVMPPGLVFPRAKAAAQRAIELDPSAGEAHASLGYAVGMYDWDFGRAIRLQDEALQRNPGYAWAHHWRGVAGLLPAGRFDEALKSARRAEELDPLAPIMGASVGAVLYFARRYEEGREVLEHVRNLEPKCMCVHGWLSFNYEQLGRYDDAIASMQTAEGLEHNNLTKAGMAHCYGLAGRREEALRLLDETMQTAGHSYVPKIIPLMAYIGLGDEERALEALKLAIEERSPWLSLANVDPRFDRVRAWMGPGALEKLLNEHVLQR